MVCILVVEMTKKSDAKVHVFGSSLSEFSIRGNSDMDVCVELQGANSDKCLRKLYNIFRKSLYCCV